MALRPVTTGSGGPGAGPGALAPRQADRWVGILTLTHDMLDAARDARWERVAALETARDRQLAEAFSPAPTAAAAPEIAACIDELLSLDGLILDCLVRAREEASAELVAFRRGRTASAAYGRGGATRLG